MMPLCNLHTHTAFCDGKDTPEEMAEAAIEKGFSILGFSGHSPMVYDDGWCMSEENLTAYREAVQAARKKYSHKLKILCGVEQDYYSGRAHEFWDYAIGSVHGVVKDGKYLSVDESKDAFIQNVQEYYDGDALSFAEEYYSLLENIVAKTNCDIIGHFDLVTKFNRDGDLFDVHDPRYIAASRRAAETLVKTGRVFEVNTGAMAKGYTDVPYPSRELMEYIASLGGKFIVTSDCHDCTKLDFAFDMAKKLIADAGGTEATSIK